MRGSNTIGRRTLNPSYFIPNSTTTHPSFFPSSAAFSTTSSSSFSGGGGGGGRGRGGSSPSISFTQPAPDNPQSDESQSNPPPPSNGHGRGRGLPTSSSPISTSFTSFLNTVRGHPGRGSGRGRGGLAVDSPPPPKVEFTQPSPPPSNAEFTQSTPPQPPQQPSLPFGVSPGLNGAGRGKAVAETMPGVKEENRHLRARPISSPGRKPAEAAEDEEDSVHHQPRMSREEAVRKARSVLSRGGRNVEAGSQGGIRQRDGLGRGRGRGLGRGQGRGRRGVMARDRGDGGWGWRREDTDEGDGEGLNLGGDPADAEKFAQKMGLEVMNQLEEGLEEICERVLPNPAVDDLVDALHTNCMIEFEPEYLMGEFGKNPNIDERPPMPIRDMLEKVKPFLMAYEGIQSQEEWEEAVEDVMKNVPLLKEIVDYYSGPDKVSAKKQKEELQRIAETIPVTAPPPVKRFADRAVLSLQSNPGWKYDKKRQFMGKLMQEFSQQYK